MNNKVYGIDLGTTNSLIGYGDTLLGPMVPSIVDIRSKSAGENLREDFNTSRSFKVNMSCGVEGNESVMASALVLKELVKQAEFYMNNLHLIGNDTAYQSYREHNFLDGAFLHKDSYSIDYNSIIDVVIAVPAFFSDNQRSATIKAAELIGLNVRALINEPTAAAMYKSSKARKLFVVYDLGGGTFDISVVDGRLGMFDVQATSGLVLGGDNLDAAIRGFVIKQCKFKSHKFTPNLMGMLKAECEKAKIEIQKTRKYYVIDLADFSELTTWKNFTLTVDDYIKLMKLTFKQTIVETKKVINQAIVPGDFYEFLAVGGSTRCPFLKEWVTEEIGKDFVKMDYNPDLVVAQGTVLYAKLIETGEAETVVSDIISKPLSVELYDGTVRVIVPKDSKTPIKDSIVVTNPVEADEISIRLYQGESLLAVGNEYICTLEYPLGTVKPANSVKLTITLEVDVNGVLHLSAKEPLKPAVVIEKKRN